MFVRWGQVIANVFRVIKSFVMGVWEFVKRIWQSFSETIEGVFGKSKQSITDLANLVLFKIQAVVSFIWLAIEPFLKYIGKAFGKLLKIGIGFAKGFTLAMRNVLPVLGELFIAIKGVADALGLSGVNNNILIKTFRTLGNVVGSVLMPILRGLASTFDLVAAGINDMSIQIEMSKASWSGDQTRYKQLLKEREALNVNFFEKQKKRWGQQVEDWKASGRDIKATWEEADTGIKGQVTNNTTSGTTINDNKVVHINVNGANSPEKTAEAVKQSLTSQLRESKFRTGGR